MSRIEWGIPEDDPNYIRIRRNKEQQNNRFKPVVEEQKTKGSVVDQRRRIVA